MAKKFTFTPVDGCRYNNDYAKVCYDLNKCHEDKNWEKACRIIRNNVLDDLFFFIYFVGGIKDANHPFIIDRINEYQDVETKSLNLWFRLGYKSTIITVYGLIQELLRRDIEATIFSHTRDIAKVFLRRIKVILEQNGLLKAAFHDKIPDNPQDKKGLVWDINVHLQLLNGMKFGSYVNAYGLVDGLPTGIHPKYIVYDDVIERKAVSTADQRAKATDAFKHSFGLHDKHARYRIVGTRYHYADLYGELIASKDYKVHCYPITHNGEFPYKPETVEDDVAPLGDGEAIFYNQEYVWNKFKDMGKDVFSTQMLMNPIKADERTFDLQWIRYYDSAPKTRNYIFVDPASSSKKDSSYSVMWVVGAGSNGYYYIKDCIRDRLNLQERKDKLFYLVDKWTPIRVYYEKYSMQADIEYIQEKMKEDGFYFTIVPVGGIKLSKDERILQLQPLLQEGKIIFPRHIVYIDVNGKKRDLIEDFINDEYLDYPLCATKDMLDCLARIRDKDVKIIHINKPEPLQINNQFNPLRDNEKYVHWMLM